MNLTAHGAQVACFCNVAAHLEPSGCFVIEVGVPDLQRLPPGETIRAFHVSETRRGFDEYDVAGQGLTSHHVEMVDGRVERLSVPFRYAWPSGLDPMAELAGTRRRERWSGWTREPFTSDSRNHVSPYELARLEQDADGMTATMVGGPTVRPAYAVGADCMHGAARRRAAARSGPRG